LLFKIKKKQLDAKMSNVNDNNNETEADTLLAYLKPVRDLAKCFDIDVASL